MTKPSRNLSRRDALRLLMGSALTVGAAAALKPAAAIAVTAQQKADNAQAQADKTKQQLDDAQAQYDAAQEKLATIAEEYSAAAAKLSATQGQIATLNQQISEAESAIAAKEDEIAKTQSDIEAKQKKLGNRMSAAYKSGNQSAIDLLLNSSSFEELTSNIYYLDKMTAQDRDMIEEVKTLKADLETLESQQAEELAAAQAKQDEAAAVVSGLSDSVQALMAQHDAELVAAQEAAEEAKRIAAEAKKSNKSWATSTNTQVLGSGPLAKVTAAAASTPSPGSGLCAAWITYVFMNAGIGRFGGNACDMCAWWCGNDVSQIQPGMIIAVESSSSGTSAGRIYGHIGVYLGDGLVHHNIGYITTDTVSSWCAKYCKYMSARCGWLGGIALS